MMDKVAISILLPATLLPLLFLVAFYRLWARFRRWQFGLLACSLAVIVLAQVAQHFAVNIPRVGKTEAQVALAKDIPWLANSAIILSSIGLWGLLIGVIGLLFFIKQLYVSADE